MPDSRISTDLRQQVSVRAGGCCEYCRSQARNATQAFSVEHILPHAQGGATRLDNLALADHFGAFDQRDDGHATGAQREEIRHDHSTV